MWSDYSSEIMGEIEKVFKGQSTIREILAILTYDCKRIHILPFSDTMNNVNKPLFDYILKYFAGQNRIVRKGDIFQVDDVEFMIINSDPENKCVLKDDTLIHMEGEPLKRDV